MENGKKREEARRTNQPSDDYEERFGCFGFAPDYLQWLNNAWIFLIAVSLLTLAQSLAVVGVLSIVMPQIEKRFNFSGFDVGMIVAANDVPAVLLALAVAHYGNYGKKIRWIAVGGIITAIGFIVFTFPHYIIGKYEPPPATSPALVCTPPPPPLPPNATTPASGCDEGFIAEWYYLALLLIGQFIAGVGSVSLFAFTPTCFQESVSEKNIPLFLGVWQSAVFIGPMVAFGISEPILDLYVDIDQPDGLNMKPDDPRWIGCWWIAFIGAAILCFLTAIFLLCFPASRIKSAKGHQTKQPIQPTDLSVKEKFSDFPAALKETLTNWPFIFNTMAVNSTLMIAEGMVPFVAKILIIRFGVAIDKVGLALTVAAIPPLVVGVTAGSLLVWAFKTDSSGKRSTVYCFISQFLIIVAFFAFRVPGCDDTSLAGLNTPYGARNITAASITDITKKYNNTPGVELGASCNKDCSCHLGVALPVCGKDGISYLSPCYAGCSGIISFQDLTFGNCSCVGPDDGVGGSVEFKYCDGNCKNWLLFLVLLSSSTLALFFQLSPSKVVVMKCIRPERLSFAFGLQYLSTKIFAHIPGPILFGHVVDLNCAIWQTVCDKTGFCWIYNMDDMMDMIALIVGILGAIGLVFFFLSMILYKDAEQSIFRSEIPMDNHGFHNEALQMACHDTRM